MRPRSIAAILAAASLAMAPSALGANTTTVQRTFLDCDGDNLLDLAFGERHTVFPGTPEERSQDPCEEKPQGDEPRLPARDSIINFLQLSDFQMVDEESPGRVEFLDGTQRVPGAQPFSAAYRPQESLTSQITEAMVRQARNTVSPVTGRPLDLTILTGDNADSQQYNETRWFMDILDGTTGAGDPDPEMEPPGTGTAGRKVNPDSGIPVPGCEATPGTRYDGVRDSGKRPEGGAPNFDDGYYDPDTSNDPRADGDGYLPDPDENETETGRHVTVRDFPGLFERANEPFEAVGLGMPWYSAFGNHDALVQGNSPEAYAGPQGPSGEQFDPLYHAIATGCVKVKQPSAPVAADIQAAVDEVGQATGQEEIDQLTGTALAKAYDVIKQACATASARCTEPSPGFGGSTDIVPPDPRRCYLAKDDNALTPVGLAPGPCSTGSWIRQHFRTTGTPLGHGFAPSDPADCAKYGPDADSCQQASSEVGAGLGRPPSAVANHDGYYSFVPKPGLRFVVLDTITDECGSEFCSEGSVDDTQFGWLRDQIVAAAGTGQYVVVFSHHTLRTIRLPTTDPTEQPVHYGERVDRRNPANPQFQSPGETLEELYCEHANVIGHVSGHEHANYVERHDCSANQPFPVSCTAPNGEHVPCDNTRFWHISTAAHIDWPQQSRMIELVNQDGQMSFVLTVLDHDGPANPGGPPPPRDEQGHAPDDVLRLASIGREIAYNDYQGDRGARGDRQDRNVILPTDRPPPPYTPPPGN